MISRNALAAKIQVDRMVVYDHVWAGKVEGPDLPGRGRCTGFYSPAAEARVTQYFKTYYAARRSLDRASRRNRCAKLDRTNLTAFYRAAGSVNVTAPTLAKAIEFHAAPAADVVQNSQRFYTPSQLEKLKEHFRSWRAAPCLTPGRPRPLVRPPGLTGLLTAAGLLDLDDKRLRRAVHSGRCPPPDVQWGARMFYTAPQLEKLKEYYQGGRG